MSKHVLYIYAFLINFDVYSIIPGLPLSYGKATLFIFVIFFLIEKNLNAKFSIDRFQLLILLGMSGANLAMLFSGILATDTVQLNFRLFQNIFLVFLIIETISSSRELDKLMLYFIFGSIFQSLLVLMGYGIGGDELRLLIFNDNPNTTALRFSLASALLLYSISKSTITKLKKLFFVTLVLLLGYMIIQTASRSGVITYLAVIIIFLFRPQEWNRSSILTIFLFLSVSSYAIYRLIIEDASIILRMSNSIEKGDLAGREDIWGWLMGLIKERPIFGIGIEGYHTQSVLHYGKYISPHNAVLELLVKGGIVSLLFFSFSLVKVLKNIIKSWLKKNPFTASLTIILIVIISTAQFLTMKIGWFVLSIILIQLKHEKYSISHTK